MLNRDWRTRAAVGFAVVGALSCVGVASAAPGDLDTSYGQGGTAIIDFGSSAAINALAMQSDGKVIGVGTHVGRQHANRRRAPPAQRPA
jgi:hypothetical protein